MNNFITALTAGAEGGFNNIWMILIYVAIFGLIIYFFMIRPDQKRRKEAEALRSSLAVGVTVTTIGGIVGKVVDIKDDFVTIETSEDRVRIEFAKWGISSVGKASEEGENKS